MSMVFKNFSKHKNAPAAFAAGAFENRGNYLERRSRRAAASACSSAGTWSPIWAYSSSTPFTSSATAPYPHPTGP